VRIVGAVLEEIARPRPYAESRPLTVGPLDLDDPGPTEVLVALEAAGVCHSDLSVVDGARVRPVPMLLGHEGAGRVLATGDAITDIAVGQRVVLTFLPRCGDCAGCASGGIRPCGPGSVSNGAGEMLAGGRRLRRAGMPIHHHLGASAFATHAVLDRRSVVPVPDSVPPEVAALLGCAVLTGGGAVLNAAHPRSGETVVVVGLGGVGMAAVLTARALDGLRVVAVDPVPAKRERARALGADAAYAPGERIDPADVVIEAAGNARGFATAYGLLGPGGRLVTVGLPPPDATATISPLDLVAGGKQVIGSYLGSSVPARDIPRFAELWRRGRLPVESLVSRRISLDQINDAMDELADGRVVRQIVTFG
jgi:alcohol dehydrogenase